MKGSKAGTSAFGYSFDLVALAASSHTATKHDLYCAFPVSQKLASCQMCKIYYKNNSALVVLIGL